MFARMTRITSSLSSPRLNSRTDWKRSPSWRNSREPTCMLLGTGPPTSLQCALTDTNPVSPDAAVRQNVARLLIDWQLDDPNPSQYTGVLEAMAHHEVGSEVETGEGWSRVAC